MNAAQLAAIADEYNQNRPYSSIIQQAKQEALKGNYLLTTAIKHEDAGVIEDLKKNGFVVHHINFGLVIMATIYFASQKHPQEGIAPSGETAYPTGQ